MFNIINKDKDSEFGEYKFTMIGNYISKNPNTYSISSIWLGHFKKLQNISIVIIWGYFLKIIYN